MGQQHCHTQHRQVLATKKRRRSNGVKNSRFSFIFDTSHLFFLWAVGTKIALTLFQTTHENRRKKAENDLKRSKVPKRLNHKIANLIDSHKNQRKQGLISHERLINEPFKLRKIEK
ncbi:MAG: hypothetical protein VXY99_03470 [Pseudomonadota bacterium]|nr:hypothetical protein [Pseudomonadota bacterium]